MTQGEKNVAYVAVLVGVVLLSIPASRDFIIELALIVGTLVWFGLLVLWNCVIANWTVITGVVTGAMFVGAAVAHERSKRL